MPEVIGLLMLAVLAAALVWLATRGVRPRRTAEPEAAPVEPPSADDLQARFVSDAEGFDVVRDLVLALPHASILIARDHVVLPDRKAIRSKEPAVEPETLERIRTFLERHDLAQVVRMGETPAGESVAFFAGAGDGPPSYDRFLVWHADAQPSEEDGASESPLPAEGWHVRTATQRV